MTLLIPFACSAKSVTSISPVLSDQNNLGLFKKYNTISVSLHGFMTFDLYQVQLPYLIDFKIASVPFIWMGPLLNGSTQNVDTGGDVTVIVHGAISDDGKWLTSLTYSRQTIWKSVSYGTSFRVTLKNIPLSTVSGETTIGYSGQGSDIHKFIDDIEYFNGQLVNGQIVAENSYVATDWNNIEEGEMPILTVSFEKADPNNPAIEIQTILSLFQFTNIPVGIPKKFEL